MPKKRESIQKPTTTIHLLAIYENTSASGFTTILLDDNHVDANAQKILDETVGFFPVITNKKLQSISFAYSENKKSPFWTCTKIDDFQYTFSGPNVQYINTSVVVKKIADIEQYLAANGHINPISQNEDVSITCNIDESSSANAILSYNCQSPGNIVSGHDKVDDFGLLQGGPIVLKILGVHLTFSGIFQNSRLIEGTLECMSDVEKVLFSGKFGFHAVDGIATIELTMLQEKHVYEGVIPINAQHKIDFSFPMMGNIKLRKFNLADNVLFYEYQGQYAKHSPNGRGEIIIYDRIVPIRKFHGNFINGILQAGGTIELISPEPNKQSIFFIHKLVNDCYNGKLQETLKDAEGNEILNTTLEGFFSRSYKVLHGKKSTLQRIGMNLCETIETGGFNEIQELHSSEKSSICQKEVYQDHKLSYRIKGTFNNGGPLQAKQINVLPDGGVIRSQGKWQEALDEDGTSSHLLHDRNGIIVLYNALKTECTWYENVANGKCINPFLYKAFFDEKRHLFAIGMTDNPPQESKEFYWMIKRLENGDYKIPPQKTHNSSFTPYTREEIIKQFLKIEKDLIADEALVPFKITASAMQKNAEELIAYDEAQKTAAQTAKKHKKIKEKETKSLALSVAREKIQAKEEKKRLNKEKKALEVIERKKIAEENRLKKLEKRKTIAAVQTSESSSSSEHEDNVSEHDIATVHAERVENSNTPSSLVNRVTVQYEQYNVIDHQYKCQHNVEKWTSVEQNYHPGFQFNLFVKDKTNTHDLYVIYRIHSNTLLVSGESFNGFVQVDVFSSNGQELKERYIYDGTFLCQRDQTEQLTDLLNCDLQTGKVTVHLYSYGFTETQTMDYENNNPKNIRIKKEDTLRPLSRDEVQEAAANPYTFYAPQRRENTIPPLAVLQTSRV